MLVASRIPNLATLVRGFHLLTQAGDSIIENANAKSLAVPF